MTEKEKMEQGLWYDANFDQNLLDDRLKAESICYQYNMTDPLNKEKQRSLLKQLFEDLEEDVTILPPLACDYGYRTTIGKGCFINHNAYFMDAGSITIKDHVFIGPNCGLYTANHPLDAEKRNSGLEIALPIRIGNNVWIGADVTILLGVSIGDNAVIGAKSLVTKDVPANTLAFGNPCKAIRKITKEDRICNHR
ncbi:hypothetical protein C815_02037 [Firmicutes bacterium M10-2]|nr:hypothetical protein C815_02037 [Firmicutes bacterium M10-2]